MTLDTTAPHEFTVVCPFGGGGGGALGFQGAAQRFRDVQSAFRLLGGFDFSPYACKVFEYLTGVPEACVDATTLTVEDIRRLFGERAPNVVFSSPPCKSSSKLVTDEQAATPKYQAMTQLAIIETRLMLDAYADSPSDFFIFENVPNITSPARGGKMLKELRALLRSRGYVLHDGFHEARTIGDLAQRRKRWFMVARNLHKVPVFLYRPPMKRGKVCGDVLGPLPLPGDPKGGAMHAVSGTSMLNLLRLWAIPAGGDWRDLIKDGTPRRERFRRHHVEKFTDPSITVAGSGSNGPCAVADPRAVELARACPGFDHIDRVTGWDQPSGAVTTATRPGGGAPSAADPRIPGGVDLGGSTGFAKYGVTPWDGATRTVISGDGNGACAAADPRIPGPRFKGSLGVLAADEIAGSVTAEANPSTGRFSYAAPVPSPEHYGFNGTLGVLRPGDVATPVTGRAGPTTGPFSYADRKAVDLLAGTKLWHDNVCGVLDDGDAAGTVTSSARVTTGAFSRAAPPPLAPQGGNPNMHWDKYRVVPWGGVAGSVIGASRVGSGAQSIAAPIPDLATADSTFHHGSGPGRYGVLRQDDAAGAVTGNARLHTGAFSIAADPPRPVDLVPPKTCFDAAYGVLSPDQPSRAIAATAAVGCGAYALADDVPPAPDAINLIPKGMNPERRAWYGVLDPNEPSRTITGTTSVGCGAYAIADSVPTAVELAIGCEQHAGTYGVQQFTREAATVTANLSIDCGAAAIADPRPAPPPYVVLSFEQTKRIVDGEISVPFAIVDPDRPGEPLALVDSLERPPFRWVDVPGARGKAKQKREVVALVLISEDGTWHRPLTTLELAVLQSLPPTIRGEALDFGGGITEQREVVGNMVPRATAQAMAEQMLLTLSVAKASAFILAGPNTPVWVRQVRALEKQLAAEGYFVIKGTKPMNFTTGDVLDDGGLRWKSKAAKAKRPKRKADKSRPRRRARFAPQQIYATIGMQ